ncbi:MAG: hypothetical protein WCI11_04220 [Candidatus Methylumidiphilus sp.]
MAFRALKRTANIGVRYAAITKRDGVISFPRSCVTAIKLRIYPFALSLSKGERKIQLIGS